MDEVAKAIARSREEAKPDRSAEPGSSTDASKPRRGQVDSILGMKKTSGPVPAPSTKRPKTGGGG